MPSSAGKRTPLQPESAWQRPGIAVALLSALALCLRLLLLGRQSLWLDEAMSFHFAQLDPASFRHLLWSRELNMAPYYLLLREWLHFGSSEPWLRLLSVIPAVLTIGVVYAIGARLWSHRVGVLAGLLLAVNAAHVAYSQEARAYALAVLLVSLSALFLLRGLGTGESGERETSPWDWAGFVLCSSAAIYSQFFAGFVIVGQFIAVLGWRSRRVPWRPLSAAALLIGLLTVPAAWFALTLREDPLSWVSALSLTQVFKSLAEQAGNSLALLAFLPLWYVAARQAMGGNGESGNRQWPFRFVLVWLWLPLLILLLLSLVKPVMHPRFLLMSLPAAALAAAAGLDSLQLAPRLKRLLLSAILLISLGGVADYYRHPKQDWRSATAYVLEAVRAGDGVFISPNCGSFGFDYYQRGLFAPDRLVLHPTGELRSDAKRSGRYERVWVISCFGRSQADAREALEPEYQLAWRNAFHQVEVCLYRLTAPAH